MCEQAQVSALPTPAPKPRKRSKRGGAPGTNVVASLAICAAAGSPVSKLRAPIVADVGEPKMAAPTGLAHRIRVAATLQSHAGSALVATGASLSSGRQGR
jgi:hypothetical protein